MKRAGGLLLIWWITWPSRMPSIAGLVYYLCCTGNMLPLEVGSRTGVLNFSDLVLGEHVEEVTFGVRPGYKSIFVNIIACLVI